MIVQTSFRSYVAIVAALAIAACSDDQDGPSPTVVIIHETDVSDLDADNLDTGNDAVDESAHPDSGQAGSGEDDADDDLDDVRDVFDTIDVEDVQDSGTDVEEDIADGDTNAIDASDVSEDTGEITDIEEDTNDTGAEPLPPNCNEEGMITRTERDSASTGTPDSYFLNVHPGESLCASITGGGSGIWSVNVSNGRSDGLYCSGSSTCNIRIRPGDDVLAVTAVTTDIGSYTLTIKYRPR